MRVLTAVCTVVVLAVATTSPAQVPAGGEFQVNTYTTSRQHLPAVAHTADGGFVVAWGSYGQEGWYGLGSGVFARRYAGDGSPRGGEFHVNTYTSWDQNAPAVAADTRGNFVVVWSSDRGQDGDGTGVFGQRFGRGGERLGAEFQVNSYTTGFQDPGSVAVHPDGKFIVGWTGELGQTGSGRDAVTRLFDAAGAPIGVDFLVNAYTTGLQGAPVVASVPRGFVFAWSDYQQDGFLFGVSGRRYDAFGAPLGGDFRINSFTPSSQYDPAVATAATGAFVVVWSSYAQDGSRPGIFGQRFDPDGNRAGGEFQVNTFTSGTQAGPSVAMDRAGNFVVAWISIHQDGSHYGIFGRRFDAAAVARGAEFQVNAYTTEVQVFPAASSDSIGNFVVAWTSYGQDGYGSGVFAQRFGGLLPAALAVDTAANGILEPGESVDVRPSWHNASGAAQSFASTALSFTGPGGATYTITDGSADYGAVANGSTAACSDCLGVFVSNRPVRPVLHWDATLEEKITPDVQGQDMLWALHIGGSFTDVPASSAYYRFVETLLHNGVTGGCTADGYCPSGSTPREQMAVFGLAAKEGSGYAPPACTTPLFADVPAASPYCRWIEELARRGVVAGCGGGNYCPGAAVTREQMAVFVLRTLDPALDPPACTTPVFGDVPASSPYCRWIEELFRRGVVTGCGGGNYCPAEAVTREQMAVFVSLTFGLTLYGP